MNTTYGTGRDTLNARARTCPQLRRGAGGEYLSVCASGGRAGTSDRPLLSKNLVGELNEFDSKIFER